LPPLRRKRVEPGHFRLAHGWRLTDFSETSKETVREFVRRAVRSVPPSLAQRLGFCEIVLVRSIDDGEAVSRWTAAAQGITIELVALEPHDLAMELLVCLGQVLWEIMPAAERKAWFELLRAEMDSGITGEIDEDALQEKQALLSSRALARSPRRLDRYAGVSFAGTIAEYIHALWHDVSVRTGPEHLAPLSLQRRFEMLARWFPPRRGKRLISYF